MSKLNEKNLKVFKTLADQKLPRTANLISKITVVAITLTCIGLWIIPWVQTATGQGVVSTINPHDRIQLISALVSGQIGQWHVREGQSVQKGDPIITIVDTDRDLLERLSDEKSAVVYEHQANLVSTETARIDYERHKKLFEQGLVSRRSLEQATIKYNQHTAKQSVTQAKVNKVDVRLSRLSSQTKLAPQDGTISRLISGGSATYIKEGDALATFIPKNVERAVVMSISGLDMPLLQAGQKARLQFDGWPVFQFSGWPSAAIGTFGAVVHFVEPFATPDGRFNIWLVEDPSDSPWPVQGYVSLGSKVRGWVLLHEVSLGYELWRQLNSFPPKYSGPGLDANDK